MKPKLVAGLATRRTADYALDDLEAAIDRLGGLPMSLPQMDRYAWNMSRGRALLMVMLRESQRGTA